MTSISIASASIILLLITVIRLISSFIFQLKREHSQRVEASAKREQFLNYVFNISVFLFTLCTTKASVTLMSRSCFTNHIVNLLLVTAGIIGVDENNCK